MREITPEMIVDAVPLMAQRLWTEAGSDIGKRDASLNEICKILALVDSVYVRTEYVNMVAKLCGANKKHVQTLVDGYAVAPELDENTVAEASNLLPKGVDAEEYLQNGFYALEDGLKTGYYFNMGKGAEQVRLSNFVIKPLFHVYSPNAEENKRMVQISNGTDSKILDMTSKNMISLEQFSSTVYNEGFYLFEGNKAHLLKLNKAIGNKFPVCHELRTLGWQPEGFFAFSDHVFNGKLSKFNEFGITEHNGKRFYSPSCSLIYSEMRQDDDPYENDRYLQYRESKIGFEKWARLFYQVYGEHGMAGIAFVALTVWRDIVFALDKNCPLLYSFGEKSSGKSKFMESISNLFFNEMQAFNLNSGTDFAFANRLTRFRNCFTFFNEFDEKTIKDHWFQALKGAYDGEGRERGKGGSKNKTEIMRVQSTIGLAGQYLVTKDDNALLSRCIVCGFNRNNGRSKEQLAAYNELKGYEEHGLNGLLTELLSMRENVVTKKTYYEQFHLNFSWMRKTIEQRGLKWEERIGRNYSALLTCMGFVLERFEVGFTLAAFKEYVLSRVEDVSRLMNTSDMLSEFWNMVSALADRGELIRGYHYKIEAVNKVKVMVNGDKKDLQFPNAQKILLLRFKAVHTMYRKEFKSVTGKEAMNEESILSYIKNREYLLGLTDGQRFSGVDRFGKQHNMPSPTTAYVFDYEMLERMGVYMDFSTVDTEAKEFNQPAPDSRIEPRTAEQGDLPF